MNRRTMLCLVPVLFLALLGADVAPEASDAIALFDGKSLAGWTDAAGTPAVAGKGWDVIDGTLVRTGRGGDLYTAEEYGDFDLSFEWKLTAGTNSGIKYRVTRYNPGGLLGPEYQLLDDGPRTKGLQATASLYELVAPSAEKKLNPAGEWNAGRIVAKGSVLQHYVNGVKVVEIDTASDDFAKRVAASKFAKNPGFARNARGRIMLQDHAAGSKEHAGKDVITFRNITLRKL